MAQKVHRHFHLHCHHGHVNIQHGLNYPTGCPNAHFKGENRPHAGFHASPQKTPTLLRRKIGSDKQTASWPPGIKHLVLLQSHQCHWKEIPVSGTSSSQLNNTDWPQRCSPHDILDCIIYHIVQVAAKKILVPSAKFTSDLFQIEVSHLYMLATN